MLEAADVIVAVSKETVRMFFKVTQSIAAHSYFFTRMYLGYRVKYQPWPKKTGIRLELGRHGGETVLRDWEVAKKERK